MNERLLERHSVFPASTFKSINIVKKTPSMKRGCCRINSDRKVILGRVKSRNKFPFVETKTLKPAAIKTWKVCIGETNVKGDY